MAQPARTQRSALVDFFQWEAQSWIQVVNGNEKTYFMPIEKAKAYFTANGSKELNKILIEIFNSKFPPIDPDLILREHTAILCILLRLGQGKYIDYFARYEELSDRRLPFDAAHPPLEFPQDSPTLLEKFCEKQWMYCVPTFDDHMLHRHFGAQRLLPITDKLLKGTDRMAEKYVVTLYGPNNKLLPRNNDKAQDTSDANTFLMKRYPTPESRAQYDEEVNGFRSVKQVSSIIRLYGSYSHGDECNILLEYADKGTLEEYFKNETPPSRAADIIKFWENLFQLIKGLKAIHSVREGHWAVRPENIVIQSHGSESQADWEFKFATYGVSSSEGELTTTLQATSYAPPQHHSSPNSDGSAKSRPSKDTWTSDIWALGCIYSEAAMWIADGYKGLVDYRTQRAAECEKVFFKISDGFHDGEKLLRSVHDAHRDIEERLRRADYITKDVLDSMVDEMLWEEDRPSAKALLRKADMVVARARTKLSNINVDDFPRPESRQRRMNPPRPPPTAPLPPIPSRLRTGLNSIAEQHQYAPNVESWRAQVPLSPSSTRRGPPSDIASLSSRNISSAESVISDGDFARSVASWQINDNTSMASAITPFSSPRASVVSYDFPPRHQSNEGRPRVLRSPPSVESYRRPSKKAFSTLGIEEAHMPDNASVVSPSERSVDAYIEQASVRPLRVVESAKIAMVEVEQAPPAPAELTRVPSRTSSVAGSHAASRMSKAESRRSSIYSIPVGMVKEETIEEEQFEAKKQSGLSLFPAKAGALPQAPQLEQVRPNTAHAPSSAPAPAPVFNDAASLRPSLTSHSNSSGIITPTFTSDSNGSSMEYLSMNTCMEWKKAHKKVKKHSKVPPLPGSHLMKSLNDRDHIFIIDDSATMASQWSDVKRVFEILSYVVKGMSPDGTELFFTNSYDTFRRKDTSDLVMYMENRSTGGETDINYRLNLQLQNYQAKLFRARGQKGKKGIVRPMSFYILTNGEWGKGPDVRKTIGDTVTVLKQLGCPKSQLTISFISFANEATAMARLNELDKWDFGTDIVDVTRWTGNVLKMMLGPMDKTVFGEDAPGDRRDTISVN